MDNFLGSLSGSLHNYFCPRSTSLGANIRGPNEDPANGTSKQGEDTVDGEIGKQETVHASSDRILCSSKRHPGF